MDVRVGESWTWGKQGFELGLGTFRFGVRRRIRYGVGERVVLVGGNYDLVVLHLQHQNLHV